VIVLGKVTVSIEIEASPKKVFDFVISDKMNDLYKEWTEGKWTSAGPVGVGSTAHYVGVHKRNKGEEWNAEITEFTKDKSLTMFLKGATKRSNDQTNYFAFEPTNKGTKVSYTVEYKIPYLIDVLVAKRMIRGENAKIMANLKKTLEA
jgi:carbon monoxide dehydrogenase subunit G